MLETNDKKIFVLDTNVILYDYQCLYSFEENNLVIPITVLEEIDKFKKGNETLNFNARAFTREMEGIAEDNLFNEGVPLKTGGVLIVETNVMIDEHLQQVFWEDKPDHRIIAVAHNLQKKYGKRVYLVSKDINLRMKAKSLGIQAEDYETGMVMNIDDLYLGRRLVEDVPSESIDALYAGEGLLPLDKVSLDVEPKPHEFFILRNKQKSVLAQYDHETNMIKRIEKKKAYSIEPRNSEQTFALTALMDDRAQLVTLSGKAGTGKTLMALAAALEKRKDYRQIFLARPIVPLSNKDLGFLPGDVQSKMDPFMQPLFDNLSVIQHQFEEGSSEFTKITEMLEKEKLVITPLAYIRGRSLSKIYFIVDEAQNLTPHEVKTIITRAGEGTKIIFAGDPYQIDTPYLDSRSNGLTYLIDKMKGQDVHAHVTLERGERSYLAELASNLL